MNKRTTIADHLAHAAEPHLEDLPIEQFAAYPDGGVHGCLLLSQLRGNRFRRDRYFVYRVAIVGTVRLAHVRWFLVRRSDRKIIEHFATEKDAVARWNRIDSHP